MRRPTAFTLVELLVVARSCELVYVPPWARADAGTPAPLAIGVELVVGEVP